MITLKRSCACYRPLFFYRDELHGEQIEQIIIFNDKEQYTVRWGWLENENDHGRDIKEMTFDELPKKRKVDFNFKKSFLAKHPDWQDRPVLTLFLYIPQIKTEVKKGYTYDSGTQYYKSIEFVFNDTAICQHIPERFEKSDLSKQADELKKELEEENIKLTSYDLMKLLKKYNITKKVEE